MSDSEMFVVKKNDECPKYHCEIPRCTNPPLLEGENQGICIDCHNHFAEVVAAWKAAAKVVDA
tara:strand:+ start:1882 stop:2070 length:189 start_codon:yes stop_codon:yes gene_type:complete